MQPEKLVDFNPVVKINYRKIFSPTPVAIYNCIITGVESLLFRRIMAKGHRREALVEILAGTISFNTGENRIFIPN